MARSGARTPRRRNALAAVAMASATPALLAGCAFGTPVDRTDVDAVAIPSGSASSPGPETMCGEGVYTQGDSKLVPGDGFFSTGFVLPEAVAGFDPLCTVSWEETVNECAMLFSRAYIDGGEGGARLEEIDEALVAWSTAHGLTQTEIGMSDNTRSYGIDIAPDDGALMTLLQWDAVSRYEGAAGVQRHADLAQLPLDGADVAVAWQVCPDLQGWRTPP